MSRGWVVARDTLDGVEFLGERGWVSQLLPECIIETQEKAKRYVRQSGEAAVPVETAEKWVADPQRRAP